MNTFILDDRGALSEHASASLYRLLNERGWAIVETAQRDADASLLSLRSLFGDVVRHPYSREEGVVVVDNAYRPPRAMLPHTDGTYYPEPPGIMCLQCVVAARSGGASTLVDGAVLYEFLAREYPAELGALFEPVLGVQREDRYVEAPVFWRQQGRVGIRFRIDETIRLTIAPRVERAVEGIRRFIESEANQVQLTLAPGQILVADNTRVLHGRTAYDGVDDRKMLRMHFAGRGSFPLELGFAPQGSSAVN